MGDESDRIIEDGQLTEWIGDDSGRSYCDCPVSGFTVWHKKDCPEGHGKEEEVIPDD